MSFGVGDKVVHRYHGPGRITRMDHVQAQGETRDCYVVDLGKGLVVWVPIDGISELSLRPPLAPEVIAGLAEILRAPARPLETVSRAREQQVKAMLKDGSPAVLCALVRDLTVYTATHTASANDTAVLDKTRAMIAAEWQLATGATDATAQIDALLRESVQLSVQADTKQE